MNSVQSLQQVLQSAIQTAGANAAFGLPLYVHVDDSTAAKPPSPDEPMDVQIGYVGSGQLARTSTRILEQALVNVTLTYRHPDNDQANLDACHTVAQQVRDLLYNFKTDAARVEQLLTPNPFEQTQAVQGTFKHRLTLDLDVLRTIATVDPPTVTDTGDATPIFTEARNAVWDSIDNWPAFATPAAWVRKFKDSADLEELSLHDPCAAELPAIAVTWGPTDPKWWTNTMQQWAQQLFITFWMPASWQAAAEWRLVQLTQALYQAAPESSPGVSYIRRAVGRPPSKTSPLSLELVALGRSQQLHAWRGQIALVLTANFDPNA